MGHWEDAHIAVEFLGGKWTLPMLAALDDGALRHNEWFRAIDLGISPKIFRDIRYRLEDTGLVKRAPCPDGSPGWCYELTPLARSLTKPLSAMARWAHEHRDELADCNERHHNHHDHPP